MTTKLIGLKEFRLHLTAITKDAMGKNYRIIVLNKNKPILEIYPIKTNTIEMDRLEQEVKEAREDFEKGKFFTEEEVINMFK
jgi:hypothetical protein